MHARTCYLPCILKSLLLPSGHTAYYTTLKTYKISYFFIPDYHLRRTRLNNVGPIPKDAEKLKFSNNINIIIIALLVI
jgi:hypothetical protein